MFRGNVQRGSDKVALSLCGDIAGGSPAAGDFLLRRQKKVTKENATPVRCPFGVPCAARTSGRLRNSRFALRQCSPTAPARAALLGSSHGYHKRKFFWSEAEILSGTRLTK